MSHHRSASLGSLGRLPGELRDMVYSDTFGPTGVITPMRVFQTMLCGDQLLQPDVYTRAPAHTSILATNKQICKEALEVLYKNKIVRASITQLILLLRNAKFRDLVKKIEIDDHLEVFRNHPSTRTLLLELRTLAQICSTTILSDKFALTNHNGRSYITVRSFATVMGLGEAICVDIGCFQLGGKFSHIQIVHRKMVNTWPEVVATPEGYDVYTDLLGLTYHQFGSILRMPNVLVWATQTSLRRYISLMNVVIRNALLGASFFKGQNQEQESILKRFWYSCRGFEILQLDRWYFVWYRYICESRVRKGLLTTLRPGDNPEILAWATDLLSINIAGYIPYWHNGWRDRARHTHWAGQDGGLHTLDIMKMHMSSALSDNLNAHYVSHPFFAGVLEETCMVHWCLTIFPQQILRCEPHDLNLRQTRQFYLLHLAMNRLQPVRGGTQQRQMASDWSLRLLQRYLLADPAIDWDEAKLASLEDMRKVMDGFLNLFGPTEDKFPTRATSKRRESQPPTMLDSDLAPILAWEYGRVLVTRWRNMLRVEGYTPVNDEAARAQTPDDAPSVPP